MASFMAGKISRLTVPRSSGRDRQARGSQANRADGTRRTVDGDIALVRYWDHAVTRGAENGSHHLRG